MTSTSRYGSANITAEFDLNKNIDVAVQEIQTKIAQAQRNLPNDIEPPVIQKVNPEDQPIMWIGVSGSRPYKDISAYVQDHLLDQFQTIPGAGEVSLGGFVEPNLRVWLKPDAMRDLELTVDDVITAIQAQHSELPGGVLLGSQREQNVRILGEAGTTEEFGNLTIPQRVGQGILGGPSACGISPTLKKGWPMSGGFRASTANRRSGLGSASSGVPTRSRSPVMRNERWKRSGPICRKA